MVDNLTQKGALSGSRDCLLNFGSSLYMELMKRGILHLVTCKCTQIYMTCGNEWYSTQRIGVLMVMWHCCQTGILVWCFGYEHVTPLLRQCHWLKAAQLDILAYKCLHGLACPAIGKVTVGLALHWPCVTDLVYAPTGSRPKYEHPANTLHGAVSYTHLTLPTIYSV